MRNALAKTGKVAIGQLVMQGREHLVGITAQGKGLVLEILRYAHELRDPEPYFEKVDTTAKSDAVASWGGSYLGLGTPRKMHPAFNQAKKFGDNLQASCEIDLFERPSSQRPTRFIPDPRTLPRSGLGRGKFLPA
jgi:hypothetical protein